MLQFPFEETEDQQTAIDRVLDDLASTRPMDRVVCGDVGFGKTEVALRSAFVAVQAGYQVAVLVPTTLLAEQHHRTFKDRFADWPVHVELLSRFRGASGSAATVEGLAAGTVDIVIGTHKLLQGNIKFKRLGLVIVDEEHRFGVKDKERLKRLRAEVDMLTLTATPIPRTLNMTLGGLRDLSIIATPPADRLAVKTFVGEWSDRQIREAVLREIRRGGQIYFVHNRVENIEGVAEDLRKLLPEAEVRVGHGQMSERELELVMLDFYHREFNVLVCTTIIESGIDIPTANTIIINRADRLGIGAAASAARPRRPLAPPSLRVPAGAAAQRLDARTPSNASRPSNRSRSSARASRWRRTTSRSAAPASCSARGKAARSRPSASRSTTSSWGAPSRRCARATSPISRIPSRMGPRSRSAWPH